MTEAEQRVVPYLFMILFGLIIMNLIISLSLYFFTKIKNIRQLSWYWGTLLLTFLFQGRFQTNEMSIILSFSVNMIPCLIIGSFMSQSLNRPHPYAKMVGFWALGFISSAALKYFGVRFNLSAMPISLAIAYGFVEPGWVALVSNRKSTSIIHKFTGLIFIWGGIHVLNFALFRMEPGNQIWGWSIALGNYQVLTVGLFALAFEDYTQKENIRLQALVSERTEQLNSSLKLKDTLLKLVLHDIANPIQGQLWMLEQTTSEGSIPAAGATKLKHLANMVKDIIGQVRSNEALKAGNLDLNLVPVEIDQCLEDLMLIFDGPLKSKNIKLEIVNELPPHTSLLADKNAFTTTVMSNLLSNAIKFSPKGATLVVRAFLKASRITIEIEDEGIGMPKEMVNTLFDSAKRKSRPGTLGEKGTGFGMPLVKSYVESFGGQIEVDSRPVDNFPNNHGTKITLSLESALSH